MKDVFRLGCIVALLSACCLSAVAQSNKPSRGASVIDSMPRMKRIQQAVISPDGKHVAYVIGGQLSVVPSEGGEARSVSIEGNLPLRDVAWSRDSKLLAFIGDLPGDVPAAQIFTAAADGSSPVKRADVKGYAATPVFPRMDHDWQCFSAKTCRASQVRWNP